MNLRAQLDNVDVQQEDGTIINLGEKYGIKKDIRKKIFAERKLRTDEQIEAMSLTITDKVTALPAFKNADRILVYADYNHEVVTEYLIKKHGRPARRLQFPRLWERIWYFIS